MKVNTVWIGMMDTCVLQKETNSHIVLNSDYYHQGGLADQLILNEGVCGETVIIVGNGHGNSSSRPGQSCLHFI